MLLGLIARAGTFTINVGLVFVLSQQIPQLDWWDTVPKSALLEDTRNTVLAGLKRVRADLETNGKLLFPAEQTMNPVVHGHQVLDLDQRAPRIKLVTD
ncbi:MAG TPA: hypothetical protein VHI52_22745 [Verrucomicrobiae bacterium]|nr:hypothetical protein [Verrucomicrobiae bacterium]